MKVWCPAIGLFGPAGRFRIQIGYALGQSIQVVTLATGAIRPWAWPGGGWIGNNKPIGQIFSWTADGTTLAFQQRNGSGGALSLSFLAALAGTLAAVVLTGILVRRCVRVRRADILAWTIAAAAITIVLAAHALGAYRDLAPGATNIRLLDTTAPGTSLASSKIVLTFPTAELWASTRSSPPTAPGSSRSPRRGSPSSALLASGLILPILDGLDEIPERTRGQAISRINDALPPGKQLVVTCRTQQYQE